MSNLGSCYGNLGTAHLDDGALDEAIAWTRKALAIQDEQIKRRPNSVDYLERVGANHIVLGQLELRDRSSHDRANRARAGRSYLERLKHVRPGDVVFQMHLADCLGLLADVEIESGSTTLALNLARRRRARPRRFSGSTPSIIPHRSGSPGICSATRRYPGTSANPIVPSRIWIARKRSSANWSRPTLT